MGTGRSVQRESVAPDDVSGADHLVPTNPALVARSLRAVDTRA
jgi:hypothetical protein